MTVSTPATREAGRVRRRMKTQSDEALRAAAQGHMDARQRRLEAYVEALQAAVAVNPSSENSARLASRLAQARHDAEVAARRRVPPVGSSRASLTLLAMAPRSAENRASDTGHTA